MSRAGQLPSPVIAVFGGGGKTGRAVLAALADLGVAGQDVRPLVRQGRERPGERGVDLLDERSVERALSGVTVIHLLAPNLHPDEPGIVARALRAARAAGVCRVVYHSVLRPGIRAMPHHWAKLDSEELVWGSGLDATVLQPSAYVQNLLRCRQGDRLQVPYSVRVPFSLVDLADIAAVTARVLTQPGHCGATYELAGPVTTIAGLAERLGLRAERIARPEPTGQDYAARALGAMFDWYDRHGLAGNPRVLSWLLERDPADPADVLAAAGTGVTAPG